MNPKTEAWLEFAQNDLKTIKHIIDDAHLTNPFYFSRICVAINSLKITCQ